MKADFARKTALIEAGAKPAKVSAVEAMLKADGVDLADSAAVAKAMAALKADAPGLFSDGKAGGYHPAGGAKNPPANPGAQIGRGNRGDDAARIRKVAEREFPALISILSPQRHKDTKAQRHFISLCVLVSSCLCGEKTKGALR